MKVTAKLYCIEVEPKQVNDIVTLTFEAKMDNLDWAKENWDKDIEIEIKE